MRRHSRARYRSSSSSWKRWLLVSFSLSILVISALALWVALVLHRPQVHDQARRLVTVSRGMTASQIYEELRERAILPNSIIVKLWFKLAASTSTMKAGDYQFESPISPSEVWQKLSRGEIYVQSVTFIEGLTRVDIARLIQTLDIPGSQNALELTEHPDLLARIRDLDPDATNLEGYLFPDTYQYNTTTTARQLILHMVERFRQVFTPALRRRAEELGFTVREVVTLASMIEREAKLAEERPLVSAVYHNRLRRGMKLDCDPTVIYASLLAGRWTGTIHQSDLERRSPYNTYLNAGLPPGPIGSPGQASIEAALYPANTRDLFFVVDATRNDGAHRFSATSKQHQANVARYRSAKRKGKTPAGSRGQ